MDPNVSVARRRKNNGHSASPQARSPDLDLNQLLDVLRAMQAGDFSVRLPGSQVGVAGKICDTFNTIVAANQRIAQQLEHVGEVVGRQGKTRTRVRFGLSDGAWADMEASVNTLIDDLLWPTTAVTRTVTAVARGDLLQTVPLDVDGRPLKGEFLRSANIVNTMIKQLSVFTSEVTRVAREVGTDGKLGGQAQVREVTGVWKDLTESVNSMASNLTAQVRNIAEVTIAVANGDLSKKITVDVRGEILQLKEAINTMVDQLRSFASEVTRVAREVGTEGKLGGQALVPGVAGTWKDLTDSVNAMCGNLTAQVRNIAQVTTAVARGDLSRKITVDVSGEILELKQTMNTMVDQLNAFAGEVTRVAREVGTEGRLGGQAQVPGVAGTWKDLTDNVNSMASNLTAQVRNIAEVSTAIASGNSGQEDHGDGVGRDPRAQGDHQYDGGSAQRVRLRGDARGARGRHRRAPRRPGERARRRRHLEGPDRERQFHGLEPHRPGAQHRRSDHRGGQRRLVEEDHGRREGRDSGAQGHHQYDGGPAERVRRRGDARRARGRHRRQARRPGAAQGRGRHVEGPDRLGELHGVEPHRPGAQHRRGRHRRGAGRPVEEDHRDGVRRNPAAERDAQHHGRPAALLRRRGDARRARGRHRRPPRRPGAGARRRRHVEGSDRLGELDGRQPHRAGAQHRGGIDRDRQRRSVAQDHGGRARRNPAAERDAQHHGRPAQPLRFGSDPRGARGGHRRQAGRPGQRAGRRRHLEGSDRERQFHGLEPHRPGAQHRRGHHGRGARRPVAQDHGRRQGRNPRAQEHHQHHGRPVERLRRRGDARRARGRHRRQARRPGAGARRRGNLDGSHRQRQFDGRRT